MWLSPYYTARLLMLAAGVISFVTSWWFAKALSVPPEPGFQASVVLQQHVALGSLSMVGIVAAAAVVGTAVAGGIRFNAGLWTAAWALAALSIRGGQSRPTYVYAMTTRGPENVFFMLAGETVLLGLVLGGVWWILRSLHLSGTLKDRESESMLDTPGHAMAIEMTALAVQGAITAGGVLFLAQSDAKAQVMVAVLIAALAGSAVTHQIYSTGPRSAYWAPPLVIGLLGYLLSAVSPPRGVERVDFVGGFSALVRPMPLDWASAGVIGAIMGHWMSRRWQKEKRAGLLPVTASAGENGATSDVLAKPYPPGRG